MQTTWRATAAHLLLSAGVVLAAVVAFGASRVGGSALTVALGWLTVALLAVGLLLSVLQHRERERFRRLLAIGLTHHLRTSLANIQAYNEMLLLGNEESEDERRAWLEVIGREAQRLGSAVENVLMIFNDRRTNRYPLRRSVDLGALLEDVACGFGAEGTAAFHFEKGPPAGIMVDADPAALRHALDNVFHSLGRCCVPGSGLSAALTSDGWTATISVDLDGAGYQTPHLTSNPLRVADLEGPTDTGFGLEIAVVQHVARAHGGRFAPYHEDDRTGYRFELPLSRA
jgi:signal transduction histidine kinase